MQKNTEMEIENIQSVAVIEGYDNSRRQRSPVSFAVLSDNTLEDRYLRCSKTAHKSTKRKEYRNGKSTELAMSPRKATS